MAGNIKGVTIEFNGDTTKLEKSIRDVDKNTKKLDKELRDVNKALKFNPKNIELWKQKQAILTEKVQETEKRLKLLKKQQEDMDAKGIDKNSAEYRKLQREIITTESKLKTFKSQLKQIGNLSVKKVASGFQSVGKGLTKAGHAMSGFSKATAAALVAVGALAVKTGAWADDLNTMSKVYGIGTKELQKYSLAANLADVEVETIASSHVKLEKSMANSEKASSKNAKALKALGVSVKDSEGNFRSSDDVWTDVIDALGKVENETERDTLAMQLLGKSAVELNPIIEDGGEAYKNLSETLSKYGLDFVDQETLDRANQFNDQIDIIKAIGLATFQQIGAEIAGQLAPVLEKVVDLVGRLAGWFTSLSPQTQTIIGAIVGVAAVLSPLLIGLGKMAFAISSIINLIGVVGPAIAGVIATLGPIVLVIAGVVAAGVLLYKNWDKIKAKAIEVRNTVANTWNNLKARITAVFNSIKSIATSVWNGIRDAITKPIQKAKDTVKGVIDKIRGFFPINLGKIFSSFKTPHLKVDFGEISAFGKTIKYPKDFRVEMYRKAINQPRILKNVQPFAMKGNTALYGGESDELVGGTGSVSGMIAAAVSTGMAAAINEMAAVISSSMRLAGAGGVGQIVIPVYLYKNGPQMGRQIVNIYDTYKARYG